MAVSARHGACTAVDKGTTLDGLRRRSGLTYRQLQSLTGISPGRAQRAIVDPANAHRGDLCKLRRAMQDVIRRKRSSDPDLLRHVQKQAVPFLRERSNGRYPH